MANFNDWMLQDIGFQEGLAMLGGVSPQLGRERALQMQQYNAQNQVRDALGQSGGNFTMDTVRQIMAVDPETGMKLLKIVQEQELAKQPQFDLKFNPVTGEQVWLDKRSGMPISGGQMGGGAMQGGQELPPELQGANPAVQQKFMEAQAAASGKIAGEKGATKQSDIATAQQAIDVIDTLKTHPGLKGAVGAKNMSFLFGLKDEPIAGTDEADFTVMLDQLKGGVFLQAYQTLKGGGQITEVEGKKAEAAIARLNRAQSEGEFVKALDDFKEAVNKGIKRLGGEEYKPLDVPDTVNTLAPDEVEFLKSQGLL